tara:strand:- start:58 stop:597 length:540 start_codon:yes stop_codon:yes gene_type:complete
MAYDQKNQAGRGPKQKTGAGIPSALLQQTPATGEEQGVELEKPAVTDEKEGTPVSPPQHPGFDKSYFGKGFQASTEEGGDVANVLNERTYNEGREKQIAWEANNKFPKADDRLTGRYTGKYRINQINDDGSYTLSPKDGFRSDESTISRRDMRLSLMHDTYVPKITKKGRNDKVYGPDA